MPVVLFYCKNMKHYICYTIGPVDVEHQEILIALLEQLGFEAFEQNDDILTANASKEAVDTHEVEALLKERSVGYTRSEIDEVNWNQQWESSFQPIIIGDECAIRACFHAQIVGVRHELVITPKMSFGTGHHATTWQMVKTMGEMDLTGKDVIDFGSGTGILAIYAEKLGAKHVVAVDNDDLCIENSTENIEANGCSRVIIQKAEDLKGQMPADVILANINKNVILANMQDLKDLLNPQGEMLLSGLLVEDQADIVAAATEKGLSLTGRSEMNGWISLRFQHAA